MFADDMTLVARSRTSIKRMLQMLRAALARKGLKLHPEKCKLQNNLSSQQADRLKVEEDFIIDIVPPPARRETAVTSSFLWHTRCSVSTVGISDRAIPY